MSKDQFVQGCPLSMAIIKTVTENHSYLFQNDCESTNFQCVCGLVLERNNAVTFKCQISYTSQISIFIVIKKFNFYFCLEQNI